MRIAQHIFMACTGTPIFLPLPAFLFRRKHLKDIAFIFPEVTCVSRLSLLVPLKRPLS